MHEHKYKFISSTNLKGIVTEHDGLVINSSINIVEGINLLPNLKAIKINFDNELLKRMEIDHFQFLENLLSHVNLEYLEMRCTDKWKVLPSAITNQPLKHLKFSNCKYLEDISAISEIDTLETLFFVGKIVDLGASFGNLKLRDLNINAIVIKNLEQVGKIASLNSLTIKSYHGEKLNFQFDKFKHLKRLNLSSLRKLTVLPPFASLKSLEILEISDLPKITEISNDFKGLKMLSSVHIGHSFRNLSKASHRNYGTLLVQP